MPLTALVAGLVWRGLLPVMQLADPFPVAAPALVDPFDGVERLALRADDLARVLVSARHRGAAATVILGALVESCGERKP